MMTNASHAPDIAPASDQEELGVKDVARSLRLFSRIWFREGKVWKAFRALAAAVGLRVGRMFIKLDPVPIQPAENLEDIAKEASFARSIFDDIAEIDLPPIFKGIVDEMVQDANNLITSYVLE